MTSKKTTSGNWNLYWVESDGIEDCFVIARNSRSAGRIECDMNGFETEDVKAKKIARVPEHVHKAYKKKPVYKEHGWPWYAFGKEFFRSLGAQFRMIGREEQMLLGDVVYSISEYVPCSIHREYSIGKKAILELSEVPDFMEYPVHDEDIWDESEFHTITMIGLLLVRCQQIENYLANSFLFGAISQKERDRYRTINDLREGWKRKTFGQMLRAIEEEWEIQPILKSALELFRDQRNLLVHGITTHERYDIRTHWGRQELAAFLSFFDIHSRAIKTAFRASYYASIDYGIHQWGTPDGVPQDIFGEKEKEEIAAFFQFFMLKEH